MACFKGRNKNIPFELPRGGQQEKAAAALLGRGIICTTDELGSGSIPWTPGLNINSRPVKGIYNPSFEPEISITKMETDGVNGTVILPGNVAIDKLKGYLTSQLKIDQPMYVVCNLWSASISKTSSSEANLDDPIKHADSEFGDDAVAFVGEYGNRYIPTVIGGGVLEIRITSKDEISNIKLPSGLRGIKIIENGGDKVVMKPGKVSISDLEKLIQKWEMSVRKAGGPKVTKVSLSGYDSIPHINVPLAVHTLNLDKYNKWKAAKDAMRTARNQYDIDDYRRAVKECKDLGLNDHSVESAEEEIRELLHAIDDLDKAIQKENSDAIAEALQNGESIHIVEWVPEKVDRARTLLNALEESTQRMQLAKARNIVDLIDSVEEAHRKGFSHLPEFKKAGELLADRIAKLADDIKKYGKIVPPNEPTDADGVKLNAQEVNDRLQSLPDSNNLAGAILAAAKYKQNLDERTAWEKVQRDVGFAYSTKDIVKLRSLRSRIQDDSFLDHELKTKAIKMLENHKSNLQMTENIENTLTQSMHDNSSLAIESALLEVDAKETGLVARPVDQALIDRARKQLFKLFQQELRAHLADKNLAMCESIKQRMEICNEDTSPWQAQIEILKGERNKADEWNAAQENLKIVLQSGDPFLLRNAFERAQSLGIKMDFSAISAQLKELEEAQKGLELCMNADRVALAFALEKAEAANLQTPLVTEAMAKIESEKTAKLLTAIKNRDFNLMKYHLQLVKELPIEEQEQIRDVVQQAEKMSKDLEYKLDKVRQAMNDLNYDPLKKAVESAKKEESLANHRSLQKAEKILHEMERSLKRLGDARTEDELRMALKGAREYQLEGRKEFAKAHERFATIVLGGAKQMDKASAKAWVDLCITTGIVGPQPVDDLIFYLCRENLPDPVDNRTLHYLRNVFALATGSHTFPDVLEKAFGKNEKKETITQEEFQTFGNNCAKAKIDLGEMIWWCFAAVEADQSLRLYNQFKRQLQLRYQEVIHECQTSVRALQAASTSLDIAKGDGKKKVVDARHKAMDGVIEEINLLREGCEQKEQIIADEPMEKKPNIDACLESARQRVPPSIKFGAKRALMQSQYSVLEGRMLALHELGKMAVEGDLKSNSMKTIEVAPRPIPGGDILPVSEGAAMGTDISDKTFLQLMGHTVPPTFLDPNYVFRKVEVYRLRNKGSIEDEFEEVVHTIVGQARQRSSGGLTVSLRPLIVDLLKRRTRPTTILNALKTQYEADQRERMLLKKHLMPRDIIVGLIQTTEPMTSAKILSLAAVSDCVLPLLYPALGAKNNLHQKVVWPSFSDVLSSPQPPLVVSVGPPSAMGKSYLLKYLYALAEVHLQSGAKPPLLIHSSTNADLILDMTREEVLRGVSLADVHAWTPEDCVNEHLLNTLASFSGLVMLHFSFPKYDEDEVIPLLNTIAKSGKVPVVIFIRDISVDDLDDDEQGRFNKIVENMKKWGSAHVDFQGVYAIPPLHERNDMASEMKTLRKSKPVSGEKIPLEAVLDAATKKEKLPVLSAIQERYQDFSKSKPVPSLDQKPRKLISEFGRVQMGHLTAIEGSVSELVFPLTHNNQVIAKLLKDKMHMQRKTKEYLEPEARKTLENQLDELEKEIIKYRKARRQALVHPLCEMFATVITSKPAAANEFSSYLTLWKKEKGAPLNQIKLGLRKELDQIKDDPKQEKATRSTTRKIQKVQAELDSFDISLDSFWLEFMMMAECQRSGAWKGEVQGLSREVLLRQYVQFVKAGNPMNFLHSSPLQFGAFEPMRWHPSIVGSPLFGTDFLGDVLREFDQEFKVSEQSKPLLVVSVIGVQSSGKSTLLNYLFGASFVTHSGRCTRGLYLSLLETESNVVLILDTEGLLSVESRDDVFDKQVALMTMACSHLVIVNNRGELGRHIGDLFQVCLFALYHLNLAKIAPAIGFVLQGLSMVNESQQYEWVSTVKKTLEESVQELQKQESGTFRLQDLVHLDNDSIFIMPSAFNDDVQFGVQVSRPTALYALQALNLRQTVFKWIDNAKASQKDDATFESLSKWYDHARMVWANLEMCGTDLLQFRTMRQVLLAQQLEEFCSALVQKHVEEGLAKYGGELIQRKNRELQNVKTAEEVKIVDNEFMVELDLIQQNALREMHDEFDAFIAAHDKRFTDIELNNNKKYSLQGAVKRFMVMEDTYWRKCMNLALERVSMDSLFDEINFKVNQLLKEQGANINVGNIEEIFLSKWNQVLKDSTKKQQPNFDKIVLDTLQTYNASLLAMKNQFRKAHIFHSVKALNPADLNIKLNSAGEFQSLLDEKKVGQIFIPDKGKDTENTRPAQNNLDAVWFKLGDGIRFEVNKNGAFTDSKATKALHQLNQDLESSEPLKKCMADMGSHFLQGIFSELVKATIHCIYQYEMNRFRQRLAEVEDKKMQKLWELQANVDGAKREVHCAKVWVKKLYDALNKEFKDNARTLSKDIVGKIQNIMTNPAEACNLAIERSFTQRKWDHVVMYCIDPTQYLYREFHYEWETFQGTLLNQSSTALSYDFGECLKILESKMGDLKPDERTEAGRRSEGSKSSMNIVSDRIIAMVEKLHNENIRKALLAIVPTFSEEENWALENIDTFCEFAQIELQKYRATSAKMGKTDMESLMLRELAAQKTEVWQIIHGCPARCPGCGTKCNCESEDHWPQKPHECQRHLYPAFNGWQKADDRKPFLFHCRSPMQWKIARTRPPLEAGGKIRKWGDFKSMLRDEHPDWLNPSTKDPMPSMAPDEQFNENATEQSESIAKEIEENRRAWSNCRHALMQHYTTMADDTRMSWINKYRNDTGALKETDFPKIFDELFENTPGQDSQRAQQG